MASAFDTKESELQNLKSCNAQKTQPNGYLDPDIFLFPQRPFISKDYVPPLHVNKKTHNLRLSASSDQYLSNEPELTQCSKVGCSSKNFSIVSTVFLFLTVGEWPFFLHFSYWLWYVLHSIKALCTILVK